MEGHIKHSEANGINGQQQQQQEEKVNDTSGFVARVTSFPIVNDSLSRVQGLANRSPLASYAWSKANSTWTMVKNNQPKYVHSYYEYYVEPQLRRADHFGCKTLDLIQTRFPVVNKPTADIVEAVKAPPSQIIADVKGRLATVTMPAQSAASQVDKQLGRMVDNLEATLDKYLPPPPNKDRSTTTNANSTDAEKSHVLRIYRLLNETSSRLSLLVSDQVTKHVPRSRQELVQLAQSSHLVQSATAQLQFIQETLRHSITVYSEAAQKQLPAAVTTRLHQLHGALTHQLNQIVDFLKTRTELPDWFKARLQAAAEAATVNYEYARSQYARTDISRLDKVKNIAQRLNSELMPVLKSVQCQIQQYTDTVCDKAKQELKVPLAYLGLADQKA